MLRLALFRSGQWPCRSAVGSRSPSGPTASFSCSACTSTNAPAAASTDEPERVRRPEAFAKQLHQAATAQTVTITGSATAARLISEPAAQLVAVLARRDELEKEIEQAFFALPEASILRSLPGIGPRLGRVQLWKSAPSPASVRLHTGRLGSTPWNSGTSINANMPSRFGNHRLKNALFLAAFASLRHAPSRTNYATGSAHRASGTIRPSSASSYLVCQAALGRAAGGR